MVVGGILRGIFQTSKVSLIRTQKFSHCLLWRILSYILYYNRAYNGRVQLSQATLDVQIEGSLSYFASSPQIHLDPLLKQTHKAFLLCASLLQGRLGKWERGESTNPDLNNQTGSQGIFPPRCKLSKLVGHLLAYNFRSLCLKFKQSHHLLKKGVCFLM